MKLLTPGIFETFTEIVAAMSMREQDLPGENNMSKDQGDPGTAQDNRRELVTEIGFDISKLATPQQKHTDITHVVRGEYHAGTADALISDEPGWLLGITVADCVPLLLYDPETGGYGVVHSGWKGSAQNIAGGTVAKMVQEFSVRPKNLIAWIGPSAGKESYEVEYDVVSQFNPRYSQPAEDEKWLFDNKSVVCDQLIDSGLAPDKIEISSLDTISNQELHSARRDGDESGRMLVVIGRT